MNSLSPRPAASRRFGFLLALVAIAAFALRVGVAARFQGLSAPPDRESNPDQLDYEEFGWSLAHGDGYALADGQPTARRPPGTSFILAPVYRLFGRDWRAGRVWFCALSAATTIVSGLLAAELFGELAGALAALLLAVLPGHFYYAMHFLSEVPYGFWITLACWLAAKTLRAADERRRSFPLALAAGACFGAAMLTRPQVAFAGAIAFAGALLSPRLLRAARVRCVLLAGLAALALVAPWVVRNERVMGKSTLSTVGGFTFWGANNAKIAADPATVGSWMPVDTLIDAAHPLNGTELENDASAWRYGAEWLKAHPGEWPRLFAMKLVRHLSAFRATTNRAVYWSFALAWLVVGPLFALGAWLALRRARAATLLVLAPILSTLVTALIFYGSIRFRDADAPLYVIPAAALVAAFLPMIRPHAST